MHRDRGWCTRTPGRAGLGGYTVDETELRHEAGIEHETNMREEAHAVVRAKYGARKRMSYEQDWLAG